MRAIIDIKAIAELQNKPITDVEAKEVYTKLANAYIDGLLQGANSSDGKLKPAPDKPKQE